MIADDAQVQGCQNVPEASIGKFEFPMDKDKAEAEVKILVKYEGQDLTLLHPSMKPSPYH